MSVFSEESDTNVLRVDGIWKSFDGKSVLRGISFALKQAEILGIIGPSGGGKTTLLRCLNVLETINRGLIEYFGRITLSVNADGKVVIEAVGRPARPFEATISALRRDIGFVFQGFNLWEEKTVLENLTLAPRAVLGKTKQEVEEKSHLLGRQFGIEDKFNVRGWQLSGGQKQRVAIMRALMMEPKVILLDEITSALDPVLTVEVMQAIRQLRDLGLAMIVVTHHIDFASSLCDRIMFLAHGSAIQVDTPDKLRNSPATDEVKKFLEILQSAR